MGTTVNLIITIIIISVSRLVILIMSDLIIDPNREETSSSLGILIVTSDAHHH
jgi:hypothetical protein